MNVFSENQSEKGKTVQRTFKIRDDLYGLAQAFASYESLRSGTRVSASEVLNDALESYFTQKREQGGEFWEAKRSVEARERGGGGA